MKKIATLLAIVSVFTLLIIPVNAEKAYEVFEDVPKGVWYTEPVDFVYRNKIMTGISSTIFSPSKPLTREEFVFIYVKAYDELLRKIEIPHYEKMSFSDVEPNQWYSDHIEYAYQTGNVSGVGNGKFGLGLNIKREDAATILSPGIKSDEELTVEYWGCNISDMDKVSSYARNAVTRACSVTHIRWHYLDSHDEIFDPIFVGNENYEFMPQKSLTRAEFAAVLRSALNMNPVFHSNQYD